LVAVEVPEPIISETSLGVMPASRALIACNFTSGGNSFRGMWESMFGD
jgi:hypothetical protein